MRPEGKDERTVKLPRALTLLMVLVALSVPCHAADQGTDLSAGYSFFRIDDGDRHGANAALGFDLFGPIDGFVDVGSHWGTKDGTDLSDLTVMAGPGLRFGKRGGTVFFVRALAGLVRDRASIGVLDVDITETSSRFGVLAGGGVDVRIAHRLAIRLQGDYLWNDVPEGGKASGFRAGAGLVYRFGTLP
jgi:opacity protein-like surface antigen